MLDQLGFRRGEFVMIARSAALALMLMAFCVAALAEAQDNANPPLAGLPLAETIFTPSGIPAESPFASFQEQRAIIGQNLDWLGVNSAPVSVTAAVQDDGTILITAASFVVRLSADGQIVERREPDKRIVGMIAPYNVAARPLGLVQQNIDSFSFGANGTPLPKDGLVDEVRKAREACLIVAEERIREAQLIEAVTGRDDPLVQGEIGGYLLERGVDPIALDGEIIRFRQWAHQNAGLGKGGKSVSGTVSFARMCLLVPQSRVRERKGRQKEWERPLRPTSLPALPTQRCYMLVATQSR